MDAMVARDVLPAGNSYRGFLLERALDLDSKRADARCEFDDADEAVICLLNLTGAALLHAV